MDKYVGYMYVSGEFVKSHYSELYTKKQRKKIDVNECYCVYYYDEPETKKCPPWMAYVSFKIPDISDDMKHLTYNTSSIYALELCNYEYECNNSDSEEE
jgi:hypothetical protein